MVSLTDDRTESFEHIPGVQANFTVDEFVECDQLLRTNPDVIAALAKRGVTDMDLVFFDTWTYGDATSPEYRDRRTCATHPAPVPTTDVVERPADLTVEWLTAASGRTGERVRLRAHRHRPDERVLPRRADLRRRRRRPELGGAQGRRHRPGEPADGPRARAVRTRGAVLHRHRAAASTGRSRHATTPRSTPRPACSTCCSGTRVRPSSATKSAAPQSNRPCWRCRSWVGCTHRCSATPRWRTRSGSTASRR